MADTRPRAETTAATEAQRPRIVVGYADDVAGPAVLQAAGAEAYVRNASITVVHQLIGVDAPERSAEADRHCRRDSATARRIKREADRLIEGVDEVGIDLVAGSIADELVAASHQCELLVLGMTTSSPLAAAAFGTVPHEVVRRSRCPTLTVPATAFGRPVSEVVCGVDRSAGSIAALHWAARDAELRDVPLVVVEVRQGRGARSSAHADLTLAVWLRRHLPGSTAILHEIAAGRPGEHLLDVAAARCALLVVGARRRRLDLRSGAVARVVTSQTRVPVVTVPAEAEAG